MKIEITKHQLLAIIQMRDTADSMIGTADNDDEFKNFVKAVDRIIKKNKIKTT